MTRGKTQFARLMELDRLIRAGAFPNCPGFAAQWEVSEKTVQRDIDYLRDQLGAPVEFDRARRGYRYTDTNWFLPSMNLREGDLFALLVALQALDLFRDTPLREDVAKIVRSLSGFLSDETTVSPELVHTRFVFTGPPAKRVQKAVWLSIARGVIYQRTVSLVYRHLDAAEDERHLVDPYRVANLHGEWYLFGWSHGRGAVMQFAVPRIRLARVTARPFPPPADFDLPRMLSYSLGRFVSDRDLAEVSVLIDRRLAARVVERQWHPRQTIARRPGGDVVISFPVSRQAFPIEVLRWVLAWGRYARVLEPPDLRRLVRDEVRAMAGRGPGGAAADGL